MSRKIIGLILTGIISVLLITGCSSTSEDRNESKEDAAQADTADGAVSILPSDAKIGIADAGEGGAFTELFVAKLTGYLVSAGVPEENIERRTGTAEELAGNAEKLISEGCSVILVGNAGENTAPAITDAAVEAKVPLLYFGSSPGEKEIARWENKDWKVGCITGTYDKAAEKRADLFVPADLEKIDHSGDGEIGLVIMDSAEGKPGDSVNRQSLEILREKGFAIHILTEDTDTDDEAEAAGEENGAEEAEEETGTEEAAAAGETAEADSDAENPEDGGKEDPDAALRDSYKEQVIAWMDEYGKELEVIFCADDLRALGAIDAVSEEKRKVGHDVMILGFDCSKDSLQEAAAGNLRGTFFNDFLEQAENASNAVLAFLRGDAVQTVTGIEYVSVTVDNAQEILDITAAAQGNEQESEDSTEETEE